MFSTKHAIASADVIVVDGDKVLLTRRAKNPFRNFWVIPGGHVLGEQPLECARREAYEETGYRVKIDRLYGAYTTLNDERGPSATFVFIGHIENGIPSRNVEVSEIKFFGKNELPKDIGFNHRQVLKDYFNSPEKQPCN